MSDIYPPPLLEAHGKVDSRLTAVDRRQLRQGETPALYKVCLRAW